MNKKELPPAEIQEIASKFPGLKVKTIRYERKFFPNVTEEDIEDFQKKLKQKQLLQPDKPIMSEEKPDTYKKP